jgi:hypothetical protein
LLFPLFTVLALLLAPGALGASLKAGGLTASERRALGEQAVNWPPVLQSGGLTVVGGNVPTINAGGRASVGNFNSRFAGGVTVSGGALGPFQNEGGNVLVNQFYRRRLGEQAAAAANANILAIGGRTAGFAPSDRAPITNFGGVTRFDNNGVGFNGGLTTSFDNFGNPVTNEGGMGQIF